MKLYDELLWRGLVKDVSSEELKNKLNNEKLTFYWGTDPTAPSLHLGHYSSLVTAKRLAQAGHMILVDEFITLNMSEAFKEMFFVVIQLGA